VAPGEDVRRVVGQTQHAEALLVLVVEVLAAEGGLAQIFTEVRAVRAAAAVADDKDEPVGFVTTVNGVGQRLHLAPLNPPHLLGHPVQKRANPQLDSQHRPTSAVVWNLSIIAAAGRERPEGVWSSGRWTVDGWKKAGGWPGEIATMPPMECIDGLPCGETN